MPDNTAAVASYMKRLREDFLFFAEEVWRHLGYDAHSPLGAVERDMLAFMAGGPYGTNDIGHDRLILGPRGIGKTHLLMVYAAWLYLLDPSHKIIFTSKSRDHSRESMRALRQWLTHIPFLMHLAPTTVDVGEGKEQRDNAYAFDVTGSRADDRVPSCVAKGITSMVTGGRGHTIIFDDIETPENTRTAASRLRLIEATRELANLLYPGGEMIGLGTYHHERSVYLELKNRGFMLRTYPILYPTPEERARIIGLAPLLGEALDTKKARPGQITVPHRFDDVEITRRRSRGRRNWLMQHMLIADLGDTMRYPLKLSDLIVFPCNAHRAPVAIAWGKLTQRGSTQITDMDNLGFEGDALFGPVMVDKEWDRYQGVHLWMDPSGSGDDETAWAIVGQLHGMLYALCVRGDRRGCDNSVLEALARDALMYRVDTVFVETNFSETLPRTLEPVLARHFTKDWSCAVEPVKAGQMQKEKRVIESLEPVMSTHRLVIDPSCLMVSDARETKYELQHQMTRLTVDRGCLEHDDRIEVLAGCVASFTGDLSTDHDRAAQKSRDRKAQEIDRMYRMAYEGLRPRPTRWNPLI